MSIFQADILWYTAIEAAIQDIRKNKFVLDDAYSSLVCDPYMKKLYGQKELENFKAFIDKKIYIFVQHRPPDQSVFPCIEIRIGGGQEDAPKDALGDSYQQDIVDPATLGGVFKTPQILLGPVTPESYDKLTGQMTFGDDVDLTKSNIFEGQFIYDEINKKAYEIMLVIDSSNLMIEEGSNPNLTGMTVRTTQNAVGHTRRSIWCWETHTLGLYASKANEVLYLWTIIMYALGRYKKTLWEARNFQISTVSYSEIYRASSEGDTNNLYARDISVRGRVEHSWIESTTPLIDGINMDLLIGEMKSPDGVLPVVEKQGWEGEGDEE